jgi:hypothetical protein
MMKAIKNQPEETLKPATAPEHLTEPTEQDKAQVEQGNPAAIAPKDPTDHLEEPGVIHGGASTQRRDKEALEPIEPGTNPGSMKLNNAEILHAFLAWLGSRTDEVRFGKEYNGAIATQLISRFGEVNELDELRDGYADAIAFPAER